MKKYSIYIVILVLGLILGGVFFGGNTKKDTMENDHSTMANEHMHSSETEVWTCAMHPQVQQSEKGSCPLCSMDLIPVENNAEGLSEAQFRMTKNAMALANVRTSIVGNTSENTKNSVSLSGKITVNKEANAIQASYFDGRIERLKINYEGQDVRKGQLLASIYSPELVAAQQELITASSLKETQQELYKAVRNKLKLWKLSEKQISAIETSGKILEYFPIYATVSGTVSEVMSTEGDYVKKGQPIAKVSNLNTVWAAFDAYENQLSQVEKGQKISITTTAFPNKIFDAVISFINPVLNNATRTVMVRATLNNSEGTLKPGMFVRGTIDKTAAGTVKAKLTIPSSAVLWTGERSVVYLKTNNEEPVFEIREIDLGTKIGDTYEILSGLSSGEEIVTNGTFTVDAAAQLQGKKSMMNTTPTMATMEHH